MALFLLAGCNTVDDSYAGATYPASAHALIDVLDEATLRRYQAAGFRVIGSSNFTSEEIAQSKLEKQAHETARRKGADVALLKKEYAEGRDETVAKISHYDSVSVYDKDGDVTTSLSIPRYTLENVRVHSYRYDVVFLKKGGHA